MAGRLTLVRGDVTSLDVDAIVNVANSTLLGGGGVNERACRSVALPAISCGVYGYPVPEACSALLDAESKG